MNRGEDVAQPDISGEHDKELTPIALQQGAAEASVPLEWAVGDVILDLYEVKQVHHGGGMGLVYRVHHRSWNTELAVKSPRAKYFQTEQQKENFVRECEAWIELGLHPHIVSCHYVRTLGGIPRVFAEYVEGGSLADWITNRRLYEGGPERALERILDIAIQMGRGLGYAHERGLIHQDVKPANVLMLSDGTAKITDFGLARARGVTADSAAGDSGRSILASCGGMTQEYCSPEQARLVARRSAGIGADDSRKLTRRTDIWSWAVSVFEMFLGEPPCQHGQVAGESFEQYLEYADQFDPALPRTPKDVVGLLQWCFRPDESERPREFGEVVVGLLHIYRTIFGREYWRLEPAMAELRADGLNNHAVSLCDLGRTDDAMRLLRKALRADPHHPEATYNRGLMLWRSGRMKDLELVRQLREVCQTHPGEWRDEYLLGLVHLERGDPESAREVLDVAAKAAGHSPLVRLALRAAHLAEQEIGPKMRTFEGHTGRVWSVAFSPDSRFALSGSYDKTMRLWDVASGMCLRIFEGHTHFVYSVAFLLDGRFAVSGSMDETLRLWDVASGKCLRTFEGPIVLLDGLFINMCVEHRVTFSPDGRFALLGGVALKGGIPPKRLIAPPGIEQNVWEKVLEDVLHISGGVCPATFVDERLRLLEIATGTCLRIFEGHTERVRSVAFSPDSRFALSGSEDKTMRLWDVASGMCLRAFEGHTGPVLTVAFSPDGRFALSAGGDDPLRLWDVASGMCLRTYKMWGMHSVAFSPDGCFALSGSSAGLRLWEVASGKCVRTLEEHGMGVTPVAFSPDGRFALWGSGNSALRLWGISDVHTQAHVLCAPIGGVELSRRAERVADLISGAQLSLDAGDGEGAYRTVLDALAVPGYARDGRILSVRRRAGLFGYARGLSAGWHLRAQTKVQHPVAFSADGRFALSGSDDKTLRLWDVASGKTARVFEENGERVLSVALSPDGRFALMGRADKTVRLWEVASGKCVRTFEGPATNLVQSADFSPDGRFALLGGYDLSGGDDLTQRISRIWVWEVASGMCLRTFEMGWMMEHSVAFSPDGRFALSGGILAGLRLWEVASGKCVRTFEEHGMGVTPVAFSPDGRFALSGGIAGLRLWQVVTGKCVRTFEGHTGLGVQSVAFSPDGRFALSGSDDKTMRLWEVASGMCLRTFEIGWKIQCVAFSPDGRYALSGSGKSILWLWELVWDYEFPDPADSDEGARPYLEVFLTLHCPVGEDKISRVGKPVWTEEDFARLIHDLQIRGYGWLRPEGVRRQLEQMTAEWQGPPSMAEVKTS